MKKLDYIKDYVITVEDFPKSGVSFKDITPIFKTPDVLKDIIDDFTKQIKQHDIDCIVGIESRGFLFGVPLALNLNIPFILIRKSNKLPRETYKQQIKLEYGDSVIELQKGDLKPNAKVAIIDDLLATGGTVKGAEQLIKAASAVPVLSLFLIELEKLNGRNNLSSQVYSILKY